MGVEIGGHVEKVNGKELTYSDFVQRYLLTNRPVILTGLMDDWRSCKDWVLDDGRPNLPFFSSHFGNSKVQVADCGSRDFTDQKRIEMSVSEFIEHWLELSLKDYNNISTKEDCGKSLLYLKDWHFVKEYPEYLAYTTPLVFSDDWLNLYLDHYHMHNDRDTYQERNDISCSDYRFVYMGAKGTWTPLHADVFRSYSWSANVCGKKQWHFLSPSQHHLVFDRYMKNSVYNIFEDVSEAKFPGFKKAIWLECTQEQNEIIFVPSGWYHQVHNLEDTISINHNWFNAYNLSWVWDLLLRDYNEANEYIQDIKDICDDFEGVCQRNLSVNTGMNFYDFLVFVVRFSFSNIAQLYHLATTNLHMSWRSSQMARQIIFNLESSRDIALKMKSTGAADNQSAIDFKTTLEDSTFMELCLHFGRTYLMINEQCEVNLDRKQALEVDLLDLGLPETSSSYVCTPQDLVHFIDYACAKLLTMAKGAGS